MWSAGTSKPCKHCQSKYHAAWQCSKNPKVKKLVRRGKLGQGKHAERWSRKRRQWFIENPADHYNCYICGMWMVPMETTLDHIQSRGRYPELRYEMNNLAPCCAPCNSEKGSLSLEEYLEKRKHGSI